MLKKLIKYDIKSTWRDFTGIYLSILLGVIILPFIFNNVNNDFIVITGGFIAFGIIIAVIVITIISLFKIFNTNIYSKEGYLTLTLPVTSRQILSSKLIVSSMWIVLTMIVSVIGLLIFTLLIAPLPFYDIINEIKATIAQLAGLGGPTILLLILGMIVSTVKEVAKLFLACSIAHLKQFNKFRVPVGVLSYFAFSWAETIVVQGVALISGPFIKDKSIFMSKLNGISDLGSLQDALGLFNWIIGLSTLYGVFLILAYSICNIWILNNKLDLD